MPKSALTGIIGGAYPCPRHDDAFSGWSRNNTRIVRVVRLYIKQIRAIAPVRAPVVIVTGPIRTTKAITNNDENDASTNRGQRRRGGPRLRVTKRLIVLTAHAYETGIFLAFVMHNIGRGWRAFREKLSQTVFLAMRRITQSFWRRHFLETDRFAKNGLHTV